MLLIDTRLLQLLLGDEWSKLLEKALPATARLTDGSGYERPVAVVDGEELKELLMPKAGTQRFVVSSKDGGLDYWGEMPVSIVEIKRAATAEEAAEAAQSQAVADWYGTVPLILVGVGAVIGGEGPMEGEVYVFAQGQR